MIENDDIEVKIQMLEYAAKTDASPSEGLVKAIRDYIEGLEQKIYETQMGEDI